MVLFQYGTISYHPLHHSMHSHHLMNFEKSNILFSSVVFSRRFSREKCPTLTVASFFPFFSSDHRPHRVCTTFYRLHSRSHVLVSTRFTVNPAVTGSSPCFSQKLCRAIFFGTVRLFQFFRHCATFFEIFLSPKSSPFKFFDILQQTGFSKSRNGPPFNKFKKLRFFEP